LPGDSGKDTARAIAESPGQDAVAVEATEGLNQSDYLRRLARELKEAMPVGNKRTAKVFAPLLLGADIYDKLMILRALRPGFVASFLPIITMRISSAATIGTMHIT
jgi:hypothetical protein